MDKNPVITEEPLPGWLRHETEGEKPWFRTPVPRMVIRDASKLKGFLDKEHSQGRLLEIDGSQFSFKRRLGLRQRKSVANGPTVSASCQTAIEVGDGRKRATEESIA